MKRGQTTTIIVVFGGSFSSAYTVDKTTFLWASKLIPHIESETIRLAGGEESGRNWTI